MLPAVCQEHGRANLACPISLAAPGGVMAGDIVVTLANYAQSLCVDSIAVGHGGTQNAAAGAAPVGRGREFSGDVLSTVARVSCRNH